MSLVIISFTAALLPLPGGQPRGQDPQPLPDPRAPGHPRHRHPGLQVIFILTFSFKSFPILYDVY